MSCRAAAVSNRYCVLRLSVCINFTVIHIHLTYVLFSYQEFPPFQLAGHESLSIREGTLYAKNSGGKTLKLYATKDHTPALLSGGPLNVEYEFLEMHFHWGNIMGNTSAREGSEHTIDGRSYPAELHMVHRNIHDEEVSEALEHENGLTVLGFKFQVVKKERKSNSGMDTLTKIAKEYLAKPDSKFDQDKLKLKVTTVYLGSL